jgi:hypothetical protein
VTGRGRNCTSARWLPSRATDRCDWQQCWASDKDTALQIRLRNVFTCLIDGRLNLVRTDQFAPELKARRRCREVNEGASVARLRCWRVGERPIVRFAARTVERSNKQEPAESGSATQTINDAGRNGSRL